MPTRVGFLMGRCHRVLAQQDRPCGTYGRDDYCTRDFANNIGAEIIGRNNVVLSADHARTTTSNDGGAMNRRSVPRGFFALARAFAATEGKDVRIGGGVATGRAFL